MKLLTLIKWMLICVITVSTFIAVSIQAAIYAEGDWVEYNNFRYITSIAADQNVVYFGTTGGVIRYDRYSRSWLNPLTDIDGLPSNNIRRLAYDSDYNDLWIDTDRGTGRYNVTFESWYTDNNFPNDKVINDWNQSQYRTLFMPFEYDYAEGYVSDPNLRRYIITVGYKDDFEGVMYVGTWGLGTATINTRFFDYQLMNYGPYSRDISKVVKIGETLWLGTSLGSGESAITSYDINANSWKYYEPTFIFGLNNTEITSGANSGNYIWLGTTDGLIRIENDQRFKTYTNMPDLYSTDISSVAEYGGFLYLGTDDGMAILPPTGEVPDSLFKSPLPDNFLLRGQRINDLCAFKGTLYIATDNSVYSFNSTEHQFRELDTPSADLAWGATDIFADSANIYFAAQLGIVIVNPETDSSSTVTASIFASTWVINELYADSRLIWAATDVGLWKYRKSDGHTYLYTMADGLPVNKVNSIVVDGDYFWLGTSRGLVRFLWNASGRGD